jgi:lipopolysaccharide export system protein LptA
MPKAGRWIVAAVVGFAAAAWCSQQRITFRDRAGDMEIRNGTSWFSQQLDENRISFGGKGRPIVAEWKKQGRYMESASIEGVASRGAGGALSLVSATLSGGVVVRQTRQSANSASTIPQVVKLASASANYVAKDDRWTLDGGVTATQTDEGARQNFTITGQAGAVSLQTTGTSGPAGAIREAAISGSVKLKLQSAQRAADPKDPQKSVWQTRVVDGRADRIEFDASKRTLKLLGNVHIEGDDPVVFGELDATSATLTLDERGKPIRLELEGEPGVTHIKRRPGGGANA